jgi:Ca-activated chloride channel family protein
MALAALLILAMAVPVAGQERDTPPANAGAQMPSYDELNAPEAVREGNRLLLDDMPTPALEAYGYARSLEPEAREIDFVQGLAHFKLGEYEEARQAFENAATSTNDALVDDAIYSIGTTYHAEALQGAENPQETIAQLENAMQRYQTVLANRPDHAAAGDANYKAALMWRELRQQMEQQQQQQQQDGQCDNEQDRDEQQQQQQQQGEQENQEQEKSQQQQPQEQEGQEEQQQTGEPEQQEEQQARQAQESQEEQVSREQAERQLREMMQALRDRKKEQRKTAQPVKVVPVEKDW